MISKLLDEPYWDELEKHLDKVNWTWDNNLGNSSKSGEKNFPFDFAILLRKMRGFDQFPTLGSFSITWTKEEVKEILTRDLFFLRESILDQINQYRLVMNIREEDLESTELSNIYNKFKFLKNEPNIEIIFQTWVNQYD